jgi:flagellar biosynthesis protein FliP
MAQGLPALTLTEGAEGETTYSLSFQILALMTALTVLPSLLLGMTAFTRIIIVLSILRQALGTQQTPPNQVLIALALFLTFFVMQPTMTQFYDRRWPPIWTGRCPPSRRSRRGRIIKAFMIENTRQNDLMMFQQLGGRRPLCHAG